jgi:hypothetical protein
MTAMSFLASPRGFVGYVWGALAGAASAFLLVFALSNPGTPFVGLTYVASVPLFLAGLSMGTGAAALGGIIGTVAVAAFMPPAYTAFFALLYALRSEERRVGKECRRLCRSRWSPYH